MQHIKLLLCYTLLFSYALAQAQPLENYRQAEQEVVLLENENNLLPIQNLEQTSIGHLHFGTQSDKFGETLRKYTRIHQIGPALDWQSAVKNTNHDVLIFSVETTAVPDSAALSSLLQTLSSFSQPTVLAVFGDISNLENAQTDALLFAKDNIDWTSSLAAQIIFGGASAKGKLATDIPPYQLGAGLTTPAPTRLGYAPPEAVGLDSQLMTDSLNALIHLGIAEQAFPGANVLVAKNGKVVFHKAYGFHTYDSLQGVQPTDIYDFASLTKVTAALPALMRLQGEGQFNLDAPLKQYLPDFEKTNKADLTFREMLAHQARLQPYIVYWQETLRENGFYKWWTFKQDSSARIPIRITDELWMHRKYQRKMYKAIANTPLNEEAGYVYSGLLFQLLPRIIREQVDQDFERYLKETFYQPLGAYTLTFNPLQHVEKSRIIPTEVDSFFRKQLVRGTVHDEAAAMWGGVSSNAGLFSNINDLAKVAQLYLNEGRYGGERFMAESAVEEFTRCQFCESGNRRGLGFDKPLIEYDAASSYIAESASKESFGHSGFTGTFMWIDPAEDLIFIFFSNRVYPDRSHRKLYQLNLRPRMHQAVYDAIREVEAPR